ncbi:MAG: hypothetical protein EP330_17630 [Deltaproteobacteria bacterium]|nr:MAG: hypothetical protein EP330_17630 [Deltaproteobacteria bacterium]
MAKTRRKKNEGMKVGILGGGRWGQALARLAMAAGNQPFIAYRDVKPPQILPSTDNPPEVAEQCDLLLVATSASETRRAIQLAKPGPSNRVVLAGRGLEPATGKWLGLVVEEECDAVRIGALAGPAPIDEILNGGLCAGVVASPFQEVRQLVITALHSSRYRVYESHDLTGVQLAGAFVPVLATALGLASGLRGSGVGMRAMVLARGLEEAGRLSRALGGDSSTLAGLAGVGDLVAVHGQAGSPYFEAGLKLAKGRREDGPLPIARALVTRARAAGVELPISEALVGIYDGMDPLTAVGELMGRASQMEHR